MKLPIYHVNAFTERAFGGNPAAVCPLGKWLSDELMQAIASQNNLSETAFIVHEKGSYRIRWFTPGVEVDLCGHATLASAFVLFATDPEVGDCIMFKSRSGELTVSRHDQRIRLDFPVKPLTAVDYRAVVARVTGIQPRTTLMADDLIAVYRSAAEIANMCPDFYAMRELPGRGLVVTAPGNDCDFVSRWFGPNVGVEEDPVTGSSHCSLAPYWHKQLNQSSYIAKQLSKRGGTLYCRLDGERVLIEGEAMMYLRGEIEL